MNTVNALCPIPTLAMTVTPRHLNFNGGCHGGAVFALADTAFGLAANSHGPVAVGIDAHITFQAAVRSGDLEVVVPDWQLPQGICHAVFPSRRGVLPAVRVFIDFMLSRDGQEAMALSGYFVPRSDVGGLGLLSRYPIVGATFATWVARGDVEPARPEQPQHRRVADQHVGRQRVERIAHDGWMMLAVDERDAGFDVVLRLWSPTSREGLQLRTRCPRDDPRVPSLAGVFAGAGWHERETAELLGITFDGHPRPGPLLLADGFEGHPLRKDFVLADRVEKRWPGAKEPGESDRDLEGAPVRRKNLPLGVPQPGTRP